MKLGDIFTDDIKAKLNLKDGMNKQNFNKNGNKAFVNANFRKQPQSNNLYKTNKNHANKQNKSNSAKLTAPYNFVSLNNKVIQPVLAKYIKDLTDIQALKQGYKDFMSQGEKYSGYFDVELKNVTPLYIEGAAGAFSDGKNYYIPGSSLRGCLKNIFKIITCGNMKIGTDGDVSGKATSFKTICIKSKDKKEKIEMVFNNPAFLIVRNGEYIIVSADYSVVPKDSNMNVNVEWQDDNVVIITGRQGDNGYCLTSVLWDKKFIVPNDLLQSMEKELVNNKLLDFNKNSFAKTNSNKLAILKIKENYDFIVPCLISLKNNEVNGIKIPYSISVDDHILPSEIKNTTVDFASAVFGNKEAWGSRVYFEDLILSNKQTNNIKKEEKAMKPLLSPNPTFYQSYLEADKQGNAQDWDVENAKIRGYKMYWHKQPDWEALNEEKKNENNNENITKYIVPIDAGYNFYGRIRFENLDKTELGALAKLFELGKEPNCCYKLGMGKPLGLGSVEIKGRVYLKEFDYYTKLFTEKGFGGYTEADLEQFTNDFDEYMRKHLGASVELYYERMKELKIIMSMEHLKKANWNKNTDYKAVKGNSKKNFSKNIVLPSIEEVVKG